ncbi:unnamed protein product [Symbiodinium natans]|uniref:Uncharacterized protein n=1 Tax=Symbiodinium natans TaxID=878477 RepID=A0A812KNB6_9DINO|nr:unnamed protein product [Symbiodinium natans]
MEYRGGGYAILRALWDAHEKGLPQLPVSKICQLAKQWCSQHMDVGLFAGRQLGLGWDAHRSLLKHNLVQKSTLKARKLRDRLEVLSLTEEGRLLVKKLLDSFPGNDELPQTPARRLARHPSLTPIKEEKCPVALAEPPAKKPRLEEEAVPPAQPVPPVSPVPPALPMPSLKTFCRGVARCFAALGSPIPKQQLFELVKSEDFTQDAFEAQLKRLEGMNKLMVEEDEVHLV